MIWALFILLLLLSVAIMLVGLRPESTVADPVAHFKAQIKEIDEDEKRGSIDAGAATAARLELQRRIIRQSEKQATAAPLAENHFSSKAIGLTVAVITLVCGSLFYNALGSPGTPAAATPPALTATSQPVEEGGPTFGEAIEQVKEHLAKNPGDKEGWRVLAQSSKAVGDYENAARAYGRLASIEPQNTGWRVEEFEAYLSHGNGQVTPAARLVLSALLGEQPDHPAGQFYLGLTRLQSGDRDGAKAIWTALADRSASDAPWMPALRAQLSALGVAPPALSERDMAVVNGMSTEDRMAFIQSMLDRLETRLEDEPNDPEGWLMLARSYLALGNREAAIDSLNQGIAAVPEDRSSALKAFLATVTKASES